MATGLYIDDIFKMPFTRGNYEKKLPGHTLILASSGKEGLEMLANQPVDMLFLDWKMPYMSGEDVLREMARRGLGVPVVVCSSEDREEITKGVAASGYKRVKAVNSKLSPQEMWVYLENISANALP
ncbi:MAG TPA: response regulator [Candidatus Nanoarchaeia archaeon]|nr:response regulator [Candidatus Nanoarchaeia archaeon]